jgi:S1-C subfamily serine protease
MSFFPFLKKSISRLLNPKFLLFVLLLIFVTDHVWEDKFNTILIWLSAFVSLGLAINIFNRIKKRKKLITFLITLGINYFFFFYLPTITFLETLPPLFENILFVIFFINTFLFLLLFLPFFLRPVFKIFRKLIFVLLIFVFFLSKSVVKLFTQPTIALLILALLAFSFFSYQKTTRLEEKISLLEYKLGGPKNLACNQKDAVERVKKSVVRVVGGESEGSGFVFHSSGLLLTNFHVIEFEPSPKIIFPDNSFDQAEIIMVDRHADLAVLKINREIPAIIWGDSKSLEQTDELLAIGFPLGGGLVGEASVSKGTLSGKRLFKDVGVEYLQVDTTFNGGISGGPMINICGEVVGINTSGLAGLGMAISSHSIAQKLNTMSADPELLKDIKTIVFQPEKSPKDAVEAFYNYLKLRKLEKAFALLSDNFKKGYSFDYWMQGYQPLLDTTVLKLEDDKKEKNRVNIKLSTKDLVGDEIVYKYFEGYWDVKEVDGKWLLWDPEIEEIKDPTWFWYYYKR